MNVRWVKKLTLPVLAMLFVYYAHQYEARDFSSTTNLVDSITNEPYQVSHALAVDEVEQVVYVRHDSNYMVKTRVGVDEKLNLIESVFNVLTKEADRLPERVHSLVSPEARLLDYSLENGTLTLNVSADFLDYAPEEEQQVLSSVVWTFTALEEVDRVKFEIEGQARSNLNGNLAVGQGLTREMGLNLEIDTLSLDSTQLVTLYFLTDDTASGFLVPVTRLISSEVDPLRYAVEALVKGPIGARYISVFNHRTTLLDEPIIEDGTLTLNFSSDLFYTQAQTKVSSALIKQLIMTMTELEEVHSVSVTVEGSVQVFDDQMNPVSIPMSRSLFNLEVEAQ